MNHWSAGVPASSRGTIMRPQKSPPGLAVSVAESESACAVTSSSSGCPASGTARSPSADSRRSACACSISCVELVDIRGKWGARPLFNGNKANAFVCVCSQTSEAYISITLLSGCQFYRSVSLDV